MKYKLKEIFDLEMGKTPSRNNADYWNTKDYKWISIADLTKAGKYISDTKEYLSENAIRESGIKVIPPNTVIMSFKLSIGKTSITTENMYSNEAIMAFHDKHVVEMLPEYIFYMFKYKNWDEGSNKAVMGKTLNKATLSEMIIEICSIEKQREIVKLLDMISDVLLGRKNELLLLDNLIQARFVEMFGDLMINNKQWMRLKISEICTEIVDCINKTAPTVEYETEYKMLRTTNVKNGEVDISDVKYVEQKAFDKWTRRSTPQNGDVLLTREAPMGQVGLLHGVKNDVFLGQRLVSYRCDSTKMEPIFLTYQMMSGYFQDQIKKTGKGSTVKHIPVPNCTEFEVFVPPIVKQKEFATFVHQINKLKIANFSNSAAIKPNINSTTHSRKRSISHGN